MFCVECGKEGPTLGALCPSCFSKRHRLVEPPPHLDVPRCANCGALLIGSAWVRGDLDPLIPRILKAKIPPRPPFVRVSFTHVAREEDANNYLLTVKASGRHEDVEVVEDFHARMRLKPSLCEACGKQRSRYYEGILQVRADGRELTPEELREARTFVQVRVDRAREGGDFISRVEATHGGLDFYVSTNALTRILAREVADAFGGAVTTSSKLFGQREGRELHRVTSLVRLSAFQVGDVVRHKERIAEVVKIATFVSLRDLESGEERRFKPRDLKTARRLDAERFEAELHEGLGRGAADRFSQSRGRRTRGRRVDLRRRLRVRAPGESLEGLKAVPPLPGR